MNSHMSCLMFQSMERFWTNCANIRSCWISWSRWSSRSSTCSWRRWRILLSHLLVWDCNLVLGDIYSQVVVVEKTGYEMGFILYHGTGKTFDGWATAEKETGAAGHFWGKSFSRRKKIKLAKLKPKGDYWNESMRTLQPCYSCRDWWRNEFFFSWLKVSDPFNFLDMLYWFCWFVHEVDDYESD